VLKFTEFCNESKVRQISTIKTKNDSDLSKELKRKISDSFIEDCPFVKKITYNDKIINIKWNDTEYHNLISRLKNRTSFTSVGEFNDVFIKTIESIIPKELGKKINKTNIYDLYLKYNNITIVVKINYPEFLQNPRVYVVSIIGGVTTLFGTVIPIDDSYFNL